MVEDLRKATEPLEQNNRGALKTVEGALQSDIHRLGRGAGITLLGRISGRALLLLNQVILARLLGPAEFGLFALGWTVVQIGSAVLPMGLHQGVIHYGARFWRTDEARLRAVLQRSLVLASSFALAGGLALFLFAPWLAREIFLKSDLVGVFRGFAVALALATVLRVAAASTRISQRMQFSVLAEDFSPPAVQLVFIIILVIWLGAGLRGAITSAIVGFAAGSGLALFFLWELFGKQLRSARLARVRFSATELLAFSVPASLAGVFVMFTLRVDRLLVGHFLTASDVGVYQAASQAAMLSAMILSAFNAIFSPMIARLYHQGEVVRLNELFKVSTKWGLYVSLPLFLVLIVIPEAIIGVVFGASYVRGAMPMLIMATAQLVNTGTGAVGLILMMSGHPKQWLGLSVCSFGVNLLLGMILIPRFRLVGAALSVAISVVVLFVGGLMAVRSVLHLWPYDKRYRKGILASLGTLTVLYIARLLSPEAQTGIWVVGMFALSVFAFLLFLFLIGLDEEDRLILKQIVR